MHPILRKFLIGSFFTSLIVATPAPAIDAVWSLNTPVEAPGAPFVSTVRVDLTQQAGGVLFDVTGVWPTSGFFSADTFLGELEFTFAGAGVPTLSGGSGTYLSEGGSAPVLVLDNNDFGFDFGLNLAFQTANTPAGARFDSGDSFSFLLEGTTLSQFTGPVSGPGSTDQFQAFALAHLQEVAGGGSVRYVAPIPEPETYAIMLAGLVAAGFIAKRRSRLA
jgi:hypothetical protein